MIVTWAESKGRLSEPENRLKVQADYKVEMIGGRDPSLKCGVKLRCEVSEKVMICRLIDDVWDRG